eukprot:6190094-Pleurochrysis_carterae.AAC.1
MLILPLINVKAVDYPNAQIESATSRASLSTPRNLVPIDRAIRGHALRNSAKCSQRLLRRLHRQRHHRLRHATCINGNSSSTSGAWKSILHSGNMCRSDCYVSHVIIADLKTIF